MNAISNIEHDQFLPGLSLPATRTFDDWRDLGRRLCMGARAVNWLIGDWMIEGAERFGEKAREEAQSIFRSDVPRFDPIVRTCRRFPREKRREHLSFGHHLAVSDVDDDAEAEKLLEQAEQTGATVAMLRATVRVSSTTNYLPGMDDDDPVDTAMRRIVQAWNLAGKAARQDFVELLKGSDMGVIEL